MGQLMPLFLTFGDICPGFQSHGGSLTSVLCHLHAMFFFRFTSGATSADLLVSSMVVESFEPHTCTCVQPLMGLNPGILFVIHWTALRLETTWKFGYIASNGSIHTRIYNSDWAYHVTLNSVWRWCAAMTKNRYMWTNVNTPLLSQSHCTCYYGIVWTRCKTVTHVIQVSLSNK